jgi:hypothetical protein
VAARLYWDQHRASQCIENDMDVLQGLARVDLHIQTDTNLHIHLDPIISPPVPRSSPGATGRNGAQRAQWGVRRGPQTLAQLANHAAIGAPGNFLCFPPRRLASTGG